jgi:alpha-N-arabinofuranosidase
LRVFLKPEMNVALANYFNFNNGAFGMLRTTINSPTGEPMTEEPAFLLYELWAQHFGSQLVKVDVESPRAEFPGVGSEEASKGNGFAPRQQIGRFDLGQYSSLVGRSWPKLLNVQIERQNSDFNIRLDNLSRNIYPTLAEIPRPAVDSSSPVEFSVSFDGKLTPDPGSEAAPMGVGLMDSRGWNQTHSGIGVDLITTDWIHFEDTYRLDVQTPSVNVTARLLAQGKNVSGTLQIHNLVVSGSIAAHYPAYPLLTCSASTSSDGTKLFLIVFNKSATDSISTAIHLAGFAAKNAQYWQVNGPNLNSTTGVTEMEQGAALPLGIADSLNHLFPAHSMTAIEFSSAQ